MFRFSHQFNLLNIGECNFNLSRRKFEAPRPAPSTTGTEILDLGKKICNPFTSCLPYCGPMQIVDINVGILNTRGSGYHSAPLQHLACLNSYTLHPCFQEALEVFQQWIWAVDFANHLHFVFGIGYPCKLST